MDLNHMNFKEKQSLVKRIAKKYRDAKLLLRQQPSLWEMKQENHADCIRFCRKMDQILMAMRLEYAFIIQKEFFEEKDENWYQNYFSEEEYKMYKKGAVDTFLHCVYG